MRFWPDRTADLLHVFGDASQAGRGATWYAPDGPRSFSRAWSPEMQVASSNYRELHTFWDALCEWGSDWPPHSRVLYTTDNTTTAKALASGVVHSDQMMELVRRIHAWAAAKDVTVLGRWAPGTALIAEGSDGLSRAECFAPRDATEWSMLPAVAAHWEHVGGSAPVFPAYYNVGRELRARLRAYEADPAAGACTILVPDWPTADWFPPLRRCEAWHRYEVGTRLLRRPGSEAAFELRHPVLVLRLPAPGEGQLSRAQRRRAALCVRAG